MSTITLTHPDAIRARRVPAIGQVLLLSSFVLVAVIVLVVVISAANADPSRRAAVLQNSTAPIAVPVPSPSITGSQTIPTGTAAPYYEATSEPPVVPVPVPTLPAYQASAH